MKKLVVIACAALAVVSARAATVDWLYQINGEAGGAATEFTGYSVYLVDAAYYDSLSAITKDAITGKTGDQNNYLQTKTIAQTGKSGKGANTKYVFSATGSISDDSLVKGTDYSYYLVLVDSSGENYYSQAYTYTARGEADSPSAASFTTEVPKATVTSGITKFASVPEPTSGLLLLVGGALLGLRRKRA